MNPNMNQGQGNPMSTNPNVGQSMNTQGYQTIPQAPQGQEMTSIPNQTQQSQMNQIYQAQMRQNQMNQPQVGDNPQVEKTPQTAKEIPQNNDNSNPKGKKGGSGISLIVITILLIGFTIGLPYITEYLNKEEEEEIETPKGVEDVYGVLRCSIMKNSDVATTMTYSLYHTNDRLTSASLETKTTLLSTTDVAKDMLKNLGNTCETLKETLKEYPYLQVECDNKENQQTSTYLMDNLKENQDLIDYDIAKQAGFTIEYAYNQDIKTLRNLLTTEGYTCNNQTLNHK